MSYPPPPGQGPNNPNSKNPYGQPQQPYGYPQQPPQQPGQPPQGGQPAYGYPQQPPPQGQNPYGQNPYGQQPYGQQPGAPGAPGGYGYGYPQQQPGGVQASNGYINLPYAGPVLLATMGQRFLARLIDGLIVTVIMTIVMAAGLGSALGIASSSSSSVSDCGTYADPGYSQCVQDAQSQSMGAVGVFFAVVMSLAVLMLLYEWLMISFKGATFGKMALSLRVVKQETGQVPGVGPGFIRYIIPIVGAFVCYVGTLLVYLSPFFDNSGRLQGWHDRAAGTVVVKS